MLVLLLRNSKIHLLFRWIPFPPIQRKLLRRFLIYQAVPPLFHPLCRLPRLLLMLAELALLQLAYHRLRFCRLPDCQQTSSVQWALRLKLPTKYWLMLHPEVSRVHFFWWSSQSTHRLSSFCCSVIGADWGFFIHSSPPVLSIVSFKGTQTSKSQNFTADGPYVNAITCAKLCRRGRSSRWRGNDALYSTSTSQEVSFRSHTARTWRPSTFPWTHTACTGEGEEFSVRIIFYHIAFSCPHE